MVKTRSKLHHKPSRIEWSRNRTQTRIILQGQIQSNSDGCVLESTSDFDWTFTPSEFCWIQGFIILELEGKSKLLNVLEPFLVIFVHLRISWTLLNHCKYLNINECGMSLIWSRFVRCALSKPIDTSLPWTEPTTTRKKLNYCHWTKGAKLNFIKRQRERQSW